MSDVKQFTVGGVSYNVARASAVQQDEVLSLLTTAIVECLGRIDADNLDDENVMFNFFTRMPFEVKQRFDSLLMGRVVKHGTDQAVTSRDFYGAVLELNQLRGHVLRWNLEPFFAYWASEFKKAKEAANLALSQTE